MQNIFLCEYVIENKFVEKKRERSDLRDVKWGPTPLTPVTYTKKGNKGNIAFIFPMHSPYAHVYNMFGT